MTKQLLHLVMGGRVTDPQGVEFQDLNAIDIVGVFPNYAAAEEAWRSGAVAPDDDATLSEYALNWRDHVSAEYLPDDEVYSEELSYLPTDAATLAEAVQDYVQWVKQAP